MKIELNINNIENLGEWNNEKKDKVEEIISALISSGGLTGVKGGKTILHFDGVGNFMSIELDYYPYRRRGKSF